MPPADAAAGPPPKPPPRQVSGSPALGAAVVRQTRRFGSGYQTRDYRHETTYLGRPLRRAGPAPASRRPGVLRGFPVRHRRLAESEAAEARDEGARGPSGAGEGGVGEARGVLEDLLLDERPEEQGTAVERGLGRARAQLGGLAVAQRTRAGGGRLRGTGPALDGQGVAKGGSGYRLARWEDVGDRHFLFLHPVSALTVEADQRDRSEA